MCEGFVHDRVNNRIFQVKKKQNKTNWNKDDSFCLGITPSVKQKKQHKKPSTTIIMKMNNVTMHLSWLKKKMEK